MKTKLDEITVKIKKFGSTGFTITVKKGWHKNVKYVAENPANLQKIVKQEIDKSFRGGV